MLAATTACDYDVRADGTFSLRTDLVESAVVADEGTCRGLCDTLPRCIAYVFQ